MNEVPASCRPFDEDLSAFVDEELSAEREAEVHDHLGSCPHCAGRLEALCNVDLSLAGLPAPEVPGDLAARLAARVAEEESRVAAPPGPRAPPVRRARSAPPPRGRRAFNARAAALVAAAAAAVLAVWVVVRNDEGAAPPAPLAATPPVPVPAPGAERAPAPGPADSEPVLAREDLPGAAFPDLVPPAVPEPSEDGLELADAGLPELEDLAEADVALLLEFDAVEDLDVITNLDLLERFLAFEAQRGAG